jgi:hypothetical protein
LTAIGALLLAVALVPGSAAARGLTIGFNADPVLIDPPTPSNQFLVAQGLSAGAGIVRVNVWWSSVAPVRRPRRFAPGNPRAAGYRWGPVDTMVRALAAHGLQVLINVSYAPRWAEGRHRPRNVRKGTWEPDPIQFGLFARAAARRYDGAFRDPAIPGRKLPRVRYWQAWNEPNLGYYLSPQWTRTRHGVVGTSPVLYRRMLNDFYAGVKGVSRSNVVITAGAAPYGNPWGTSIPGRGYRMQPVTFDRLLFSAPTWCDVIAQHMYPYRGPLWHAALSGDVAVPDLHKIAGVMHGAERAGKLLPRGPKRLWVTELGWNSDPPDPGAVPLAQQGLWYEQALYELWRQGADTVLLLQMIDPDHGPWESGVYFGSGQPKPAATAIRFPFVTVRSSRRTVLAWGRAPVAGKLTIERLAGGSWKPLAAWHVARQQVFERTLRVRGRAVLRAVLGLDASLAWGQAG